MAEPLDHIAAAQEALGEALHRARAHEDRELAAAVRDEGLQIVRLLYGLLRMTRVHAADNVAFEKPLVELQATAARLVELLGVVHLLAVEDQVYLNDVRIRFQERDGGAGELGAELRRLHVGGLTLHCVPEVDDLRAMVRGFARPPLGAISREALAAQLRARGSSTIELLGLFRFRVSGEEGEAGGVVDGRLALRRAATAVDEAWEALVAGRIPNPLPLRRAVTELLQAERALDGLWEDPPGASALAAHTLRVTRYALVIGRSLGLSEEPVQDLGVAAMFHDLGYAAREGARPRTAVDRGDPGQAPPLSRHPGAGARLLLRQRGFHEAKMRRALATLEHHRDYNDRRGRPSLFARILRICEDYDNRVRRAGGGLTPPDALAELVAGADTLYDPVILQIFVNRLGAWPPGTLLQLEDLRIVRSVSFARSRESWHRPLCRVEVLPDGAPVTGDKPQFDLARTDLAILGALERI